MLVKSLFQCIVLHSIDNLHSSNNSSCYKKNSYELFDSDT